MENFLINSPKKVDISAHSAKNPDDVDPWKASGRERSAQPPWSSLPVSGLWTLWAYLMWTWQPWWFIKRSLQFKRRCHHYQHSQRLPRRRHHTWFWCLLTTPMGRSSLGLINAGKGRNLTPLIHGESHISYISVSPICILPWVRNTTIVVNLFEIATISSKYWKLFYKDNFTCKFRASNGRWSRTESLKTHTERMHKRPR